MDERRSQTLHALEAFVQTQRLLLARQRSDIERLQKLKVDLVERPSQVLSNLSNELADNAFRLSAQSDCRLNLPKELDWKAFENSDPGPLRTFTQQTRDAILQCTYPHPTQRSDLSELQQLVKSARVRIVDPVLLRFADMSPAPSDDEEPTIDPVRQKRELEQQKIRDLKTRVIRSGALSLPLSRAAGEMGVFVRDDVAEGDLDADVMIDDDDDVNMPSTAPAPAWATKALPAAPPDELPPKKSKTHMPKVKLKSKAKPKPKHSPVPEDENEDEFDGGEDGEAPLKAKRTKGQPKPKPETYKQAWSTSEQNLLEQLLEEIPEGEKYRWLKISQAMGGRRTPRQVASRVQKYFEKLKKFSLL